MNKEELQALPLERLKEIASSLNITVHHKAKPETIIHQIMQQPKAYLDDAMKHVAELPKDATIHNTPEMVTEAIKEFASKEGFKVQFLEDNTWYFAYKGSEESGNMSIPLRIIKEKARFVARGRIAPKAQPGFDSLFPGKYNDPVLM